MGVLFIVSLGNLFLICITFMLQVLVKIASVEQILQFQLHRYKMYLSVMFLYIHPMVIVQLVVS